MTLRKKIVPMLLAVTLTPACVIAAEMEFKGTIVSKEKKSIKVKAKDGEKTLNIGTKTKGVENAKDGAKVTIKYAEKDGHLRATEINPQQKTEFDKKTGSGSGGTGTGSGGSGGGTGK